MILQNTKLKPRYATFAKIYHPINKGLVDTGLVLWFPGPNSFTGEDIIELQVHGSPAIIKCLLKGIVETNLARIAEPGEFTRRAFYNNKMDLAEVEGLRDLLNAETDIQRKQVSCLSIGNQIYILRILCILRVFQMNLLSYKLFSKALAMSRGVQSKKINEWISRLSDATSVIDGHIEFGDTDDVTINMADINTTLTQIQNELTQAITTSAKGFTIKTGLNIALYGVTNVGKSSLLNALTSEDRAIVSDSPNTTRDLIQVRMDLNGYPVNLTDTAGFYNDPSHRIETEAMKKSIEILFDNNTAIHVLVISADIYLKYAMKYLSAKPAKILSEYVEDMFVSGLVRPENENFQSLFVKNTIVVITKLDLIKSEDKTHFNELLQEKNVIGTSIVNNYGVDKLFDCFNQQIKEM